MLSKSAGVVRGKKEGVAKNLMALDGKAEPCLTTGGVAQRRKALPSFLRGFYGKAEPCLTTSGAAWKEGVAKIQAALPARRSHASQQVAGGVGVASEPIT